MCTVAGGAVQREGLFECPCDERSRLAESCVPMLPANKPIDVCSEITGIAVHQWLPGYQAMCVDCHRPASFILSQSNAPDQCRVLQRMTNNLYQDWQCCP